MIFSRRKRTQYCCKHLKGVVRVSERQEVIRGWDQSALQTARILALGAGGANGEIVEGLVRKGIGELHVADEDVVTTTNLNRQKFIDKDLFQNKAIALIRHMARQGFLGTRLVAHPVFSDQLDIGAIAPNLIVCSVDLQVPGTRLEICRYGIANEVPVVFMAVSTDADSGYVFVQESTTSSACWACVLRPERLPETAGKMCPGDVAAACDITKALGGMALYAIDTIIMNRPRDWNYRTLSLQNGAVGGGSLVSPRSDCPVCGKTSQ